MQRELLLLNLNPYLVVTQRVAGIVIIKRWFMSYKSHGFGFVFCCACMSSVVVGDIVSSLFRRESNEASITRNY